MRRGARSGTWDEGHAGAPNPDPKLISQPEPDRFVWCDAAPD